MPDSASQFFLAALLVVEFANEVVRSLLFGLYPVLQLRRLLVVPLVLRQLIRPVKREKGVGESPVVFQTRAAIGEKAGNLFKG